MGGINVGRWLGGGFAAGAVIFVLEGVANVFYMDEMQTALNALGLAMNMNATAWVLSIFVSLVNGVVLVFLYAAARPRFGPGPKTALIVATALWAGGYLLSLIGYYMVALYPAGMVVRWGLVGLAEMMVAALAGGWVYREA